MEGKGSTGTETPEQKRKRTLLGKLWKPVVCVGLLVLIWGGYIVSLKQFRKNLDIQEINYSWVHQIDDVLIDDKNLVLKGFAFLLGVDANKGKMEIVLQDIESGERIFPKMRYEKRTDVNDYFLCKYDYTYSGYIAKYNLKRDEIIEHNYEVLLQINKRNAVYRTGVYISNGECMYSNPLEFKLPDVEGTDIENIVNNGVLRVYRPDYGMYVYQYKGDMYWISEEKYEFDENGETYVQWHLETTQIEKLPKHRLENGWYFDNLGFYFSERELSEWNTGKYRVARRALPTEYAITKMNTGRHEDEWIWKADFRPYYEFDN